MLALDIRIGNDIIIGTGDIILGPLLLFGFVLSSYAVITRELADRRAAKLIRAAQQLKLAEDVTLIQGVRAYFGGTGHWDPSDDDDSVYFVPRLSTVSEESLRVYPDSGRIDVQAPQDLPCPEGKGESEAMIDAMIQAAREKAVYPGG